MAAVAENTPGLGALESLYTNSGNSQLLKLRDKGWCILPCALDQATIHSFVARVDADLERDGFKARFGINMPGGMKARDLPQCSFWSIDTVMYALSNWAVDLRVVVRDAFASAAGVNATTLASSFDGVMMKDGQYAGPHTKPLTEQEVASNLIPCNVGDDHRPKGPTHCDQNRFRRKSCESHQIFCPLVVGELSTLLLSPRDPWTLQGIIDVLTEQFPSDYKKPTVGPVSRGEMRSEGYQFDPSHRDYLLSINAVELVKPTLNPGDLLVWSSAIPHCSGVYANTTPRIQRSPRLGIITAFAPKELVSEQARELRKKVVGGGFCTGQQIRYPSKHGQSEAQYVWRQPIEKVPQVYKKHREWRKRLRETPLWADREDDAPEDKRMRASLRCLLGM